MSVKGLLGLDDPDGLRDELAARTGLAWREEEVAGDGVLGVVVELLLVAVVNRTGEMVLEAAVDAVRRTVERYRSQSLDPPEVSVETRPVPDAGGPADGGGPAAAPEGTGD